MPVFKTLQQFVVLESPQCLTEKDKTFGNTGNKRTADHLTKQILGDNGALDCIHHGPTGYCKRFRRQFTARTLVNAYDSSDSPLQDTLALKMASTDSYTTPVVANPHIKMT